MLSCYFNHINIHPGVVICKVTYNELQTKPVGTEKYQLLVLFLILYSYIHFCRANCDCWCWLGTWVQGALTKKYVRRMIILKPKQ